VLDAVVTLCGNANALQCQECERFLPSCRWDVLVARIEIIAIGVLTSPIVPSGSAFNQTSRRAATQLICGARNSGSRGGVHRGIRRASLGPLDQVENTRWRFF
jgi:hypothetical protein